MEIHMYVKRKHYDCTCMWTLVSYQKAMHINQCTKSMYNLGSIYVNDWSMTLPLYILKHVCIIFQILFCFENDVIIIKNS